jgi:hypothetical protein
MPTEPQFCACRSGAAMFCLVDCGRPARPPMPGTIPAAPLVIEPTPAESRLLRMAQGGLGCLKATVDHRLATELEERGLLKVVTDEPDRTFWKLSGDGFKLAEMAAAEAMRERAETRP